MAKFHIALGSTVDAAWTDHIAISADAGVTWAAIKKDNITSINPVRTTNAGTANNPGQPQRDSERVVIRMATGPDVSFDIKDVANQPTWSVGGVVALRTAVDTITTWTA